MNPIPPAIPDCDNYDYTDQPPPVPSPRLAYWLDRIENGWRPNKRISGMGYSEKTSFFGVYVWEYLNVIDKALDPNWKPRVVYKNGVAQ